MQAGGERKSSSLINRLGGDGCGRKYKAGEEAGVRGREFCFERRKLEVPVELKWKVRPAVPGPKNLQRPGSGPGADMRVPFAYCLQLNLCKSTRLSTRKE